MRMDYHSVILMYTFVNNDNLTAEFLRLIRDNFKSLKKLNESAYALPCNNINEIVNKIKDSYEFAVKQYPSEGDDYVSIFYSPHLANQKSKEKLDKIVENHIIGKVFPE